MLVLATAADRRIAQKIADHLSIFDEVIASDGRNNLGGAAKAEALVERFGSKGFIYAGNASTDVAVWREAAARWRSIFRRARRRWRFSRCSMRSSPIMAAGSISPRMQRLVRR